MLKLIWRSTIATICLAVLLCGIYPLVVTAIAHVLFPEKADGGIISVDGRPVGARLIGQAFSRPEYFHGRPSSAGNGYDAANSSGSNLGPTNQKFKDSLKANIDAVMKDNPQLQAGQVPTDLVTASASGLDPHISVEAAKVQVPRVAKGRGQPESLIEAMIASYVQASAFGDDVVNVLELNIGLDQLHPVKK